MNLFDVYPLYNINIVKGDGCKVWDKNGTEYLDLYGGHAVISIGHAHPHYVEMISNQVATLGFYSNSVINKLQQQVAERLGKISGYEDYSLFLINSGAEANENALKLASFYNGRTKVISFSKLSIQEIINSLSPCFSRCIRHLLVLTTCFKSIFLSTMCTKESFA